MSSRLCIIGWLDLDSPKIEGLDLIKEDTDYMFVGYGAKVYEESIDKLLSHKAESDGAGSLLDLYTKYYLIDIHTRYSRNEEYIEWLKRDDNYFTKLLQNKHYDIPKSEEFPIDAIISEYGSRYFWWTGSYMVAWAMYKGYELLEIQGINMLLEDDYIQKSNMDYWLGRYHQAGGMTIIPDYCDLLKGKMYGYEVDNTLAVYMDRIIKEQESKIENSLNVIKHHTQIIEDAWGILKKESPKFLEEILNRSGLNGPLGHKYPIR